jgi:hypothetical protein
MDRRYRNIAVGFCLLFAVAGRLPAQNNTAEVFGGYSYAKINPEAPLPKQSSSGWFGGVTGYAFPWFGATAEIAAQFGSAPAPSGIGGTAINFKEYSYLAGPQFRFVDKARVQSSFKVLLGGVFGQAHLPSTESATNTQLLAAAGYTAFNQTKFAALFALPVDVTITKMIGIRVEPGLYLTDFNKTSQGNFRFSVGPVFRFGAR